MNPFSGLQDLVNQVPELVQPLLVLLVGAIPFVDEAAAGLGIVAGMHPLVAFTANVVGSGLTVVFAVLLGSRVRGAVVARRARRAAPDSAPATRDKAYGGTTATLTRQATGVQQRTEVGSPPTVEKRSKGKERLGRWLTRFGVPGASLLAPLALPFSLTALFLIGTGVSRTWVLLWQLIAIMLWTGVVTASATAAVAVISG
ncbi:small multidrug efflux protein [Herbiconiux sp.]|uniref:small multidrug efflux protein n=1 Tax=Herbiconiux sp. TaxID=1871186 RepID=UPI0025BFB486|nr:small multidrug efflux protein [Herbiconiux sp.]